MACALFSAALLPALHDTDMTLTQGQTSFTAKRFVQPPHVILAAQLCALCTESRDEHFVQKIVCDAVLQHSKCIQRREGNSFTTSAHHGMILLLSSLVHREQAVLNNLRPAQRV